MTCNQTLQEEAVELGTIEREIYVDASPEVVFDVVSSPDHLKNWWPDEAHYEPTPGSNGRRRSIRLKPITRISRGRIRSTPT